MPLIQRTQVILCIRALRHLVGLMRNQRVLDLPIQFNKQVSREPQIPLISCSEWIAPMQQDLTNVMAAHCWGIVAMIISYLLVSKRLLTAQENIFIFSTKSRPQTCKLKNKLNWLRGKRSARTVATFILYLKWQFSQIMSGWQLVHNRIMHTPSIDTS